MSLAYMVVIRWRLLPMNGGCITVMPIQCLRLRSSPPRFQMRRGTVTWGLGGVYSAGRPIMGATVACVHVWMCVCQSEPLLLVGVYATQARALAPHGTKDACNSVTTPSPLPISPSSPSLSPMACHPVHASAGPVHPRTLRHTKSETALARPRGMRLHCVVCLTSLWYV